MNNTIWRKYIIYLATFTVPIIGFGIILYWMQIAPFGEKSILLWDMDIQYVEYFSYLRSVLMGNASIGYSFFKFLGGSLVAMFGYYLSSPLNILVVFFKQETMQACLIVITALKIGLCGLTFSVFIRNRFKQIDEFVLIGLSTSYALSQYVVSQMSNIMWLDGVYMLPLIMLGVYKFVYYNKKGMLCTSIAFGILFNWYTGYMNCLFIPFYFLYEQALKNYNDNGKIGLKKLMLRFACFCLVEGMATISTLAFLLPVIKDLQRGKAAFSPEIFKFAVNGNVLDILRGSIIGSAANSVQISFFCGSVCLYGAIFFLINKKISRKKRVIAGIFLTFLIAGSYFKPLENIWSGFRFVTSYCYRYSYLCIMLLLYLCADNLVAQTNEKEKSGKKILVAMVLMIFLLDEIKTIEPQRMWLEIGVLCLIFLATYMNNKVREKFLCILMCVEVVLNGFLVCPSHYFHKNIDYINYVINQQEQLKKLERFDAGVFYRIEQTLNRQMNINKDTAYYCESLSYGYKGISHYNSAYDLKMASFISNLGYSDVTDMVVYDEPILSSDSLLGVKYLLADRAYPGWKEVEGIGEYNGKKVYENENALSLGMVISRQKPEKIESNNPFIYQNMLFSSLLGQDVQLFTKVDAESEIKDGGIYYRFGQTEKEGILYGYGRFSKSDLDIYINNEFRCKYQKWLSYLTMNIGSMQESNEIFISGLNASNQDDEVEFYYLDMEAFRAVIRKLKVNEVQPEYEKDNNLFFSVEAKDGDVLFTTIPYQDSWKVYVNGHRVEAEEFADALMSIPLEDGQNVVELKYSIAGLKEGAICSVFAILFLIIWCMRDRKKILCAKLNEF